MSGPVEIVLIVAAVGCLDAATAAISVVVLYRALRNEHPYQDSSAAGWNTRPNPPSLTIGTRSS